MLLLLLILGFWGTGCKEVNEDKVPEPTVVRDLPEIKKDSILRVITMYNSTSYFLYRGEPMGYQYEMVKHLAKSLGVKVNIVVAQDFKDVFKMLNEGKGDLVAFGLTITAHRQQYVAFTDYLYLTHQVLVQRKPSNWRQLPYYKIERQLVRDPHQLIGDSVYVAEGTSYYPRLKNLEKEIGGKINIGLINDGKTTDDIINMLVDDEIDYTVADYNLAVVNQYFNPILDVNTRISLSQRIAWAVRKNSPLLLQAINAWIKKAKQEQFYYALYQKYFHNKTEYNQRLSSDFFTKYSGVVTPYDDIIKKNADSLGWDWLLVAALIYQESQFDPKASGGLGAGGLMQLMPPTAKELGVNDIYNPAQNIKGGTTYLKQLYNQFDKVTDSIQRIKFSIAAYNAGLGHIYDAQRLAKSLGKNPLVWDDNVEIMMLKLRNHQYYTRPEIRHGIVLGKLTYNYVHEVFDRYKKYQQLFNSSEPVKEKMKTSP